MLNDQTVDVRRLRGDLALFAARSRSLKLLLRTRWERPMADEQRELAEIRKRTTRLCVLRAFLRGRVHVQQPPRDGSFTGADWDASVYQSRVAERAAREYEYTSGSEACGSSTSA